MAQKVWANLDVSRGGRVFCLFLFCPWSKRPLFCPRWRADDVYHRTICYYTKYLSTLSILHAHDAGVSCGRVCRVWGGRGVQQTAIVRNAILPDKDSVDGVHLFLAHQHAVYFRSTTPPSMHILCGLYPWISNDAHSPGHPRAVATK